MVEEETELVKRLKKNFSEDQAYALAEEFDRLREVMYSNLDKVMDMALR